MDNVVIKILFLLQLHQQFLININCFQHDQDILLTPNRTHLNRNKIILYQPNNIKFIHKHDNENKSKELHEPLWLEPLKHTMILALENENENININIKHESNQGNNNPQELYLMDNLLNSIYIPINNYNYTNFGDIIMLGKGILETKDNNKKNFIFKQKININCQRNNICDDNDDGDDPALIKNKNIKAIWTVEKLRHKQQNNYNYELKITIYPLGNNNNNKNNNKNNNNNNNHDNHTSKRYSFLLKQDDYPQYFNENLTKKANHNKILTTARTTAHNKSSKFTIDNKSDKEVNAEDDMGEKKQLFNSKEQLKYDKSSIDRTIFGGLFDFYKRPYMLNEVPFQLNAFHTQKPYRHIFQQKPDLNVGEYFTNLHPEHELLHQAQFQPHLLHHQQHQLQQQQQQHHLLDTTTTENFFNHHQPNHQPHFLHLPQPQTTTAIKQHFPQFLNSQIKFPEPHDHFNFKQHFDQIETPKQPNVVTHFHRHLILNPPNKLQVIKPTGSKYNQHTNEGLKYFGDLRSGPITENLQHPAFAVTSPYPIEHEPRLTFVEQSPHHHKLQQQQHHFIYENHPQSHQTILPSKIPSPIQHLHQLDETPVASPLQIPPQHHQQHQPQQEYLQDTRDIPVTTIQYTQQLQSPPFISSTLYKQVPQTTQKYNFENTENYQQQQLNTEQDYQEHNQQGYHLHQHHQTSSSYPEIQNQHQPLTNHSPQLENYHFSEPDPLYHNPVMQSETDQPQQSFLINVDGSYEEHSPKPNAVSQIETPDNYAHHNGEEQEVRTFNRYPEIETTSTQYQQNTETEKYIYPGEQDQEYPDSINAQLPQPEKDQDLAIPYVATSNKKSISTPHTETSEITSITADITSTTTPTTNTNTSKRNTTFQKRPYSRRIAEKPVIKWMPKKSYRSTTTSTTTTPTTPTYDFEIEAESSISTYQKVDNSKGTRFTENYITVTPTTTIKINQTPITQQSVSTSITYEIGDAQIIDNSFPTLKSIENLEMVKANIEAIQTNTTNIEAYRATTDETKEKENTSKNDDQLTESILNHAKAVSL